MHHEFQDRTEMLQFALFAVAAYFAVLPALRPDQRQAVKERGLQLRASLSGKLQPGGGAAACPGCGVRNSAAAKFCSGCGASLEQQQA